MHKLKIDRDYFTTVKLVIGKRDLHVKVDVLKNRLCEVSEFLALACNDRWASG